MAKSIIAIILLSAFLQAHAAIGIANLFGQFATQPGAQGAGNSVDDVLLQLSTEINKKTPMSVDGNTRLDSVSAEPGRHFTYHYSIVAESAQGGAVIDFTQALKPQIKSKLCGSSEVQTFLKNGVTVAYLYKDISGKKMGGAEFAPSDCAN